MENSQSSYCLHSKSARLCKSKTRPDKEVRFQNRALLEATFLNDIPEADDDERLEGEPLSLTRRKEAAEFLLTMLSGPFKDDCIIHHCRAGCCRNAKESKLKIWCAVQVS